MSQYGRRAVYHLLVFCPTGLSGQVALLAQSVCACLSLIGHTRFPRVVAVLPAMGSCAGRDGQACASLGCVVGPVVSPASLFACVC